MALKKPSELFGKGEDNSKISENINGNLNNIKNQYNKVEDLKKQLEGVTSSINNSLSEVVDNNINFVEFKEEYSELIDNLNTKIEGIKEDFDDKIDELRAAHLTLNTEITILDKRQNSLHIRGLKDELLEELQNILDGNVYQNIRSLEEKFDSINEKQLENLQEGLLNEPPNVDNSDPLTPLDKKYVTLDEFQEQYKLFINRIQKQLSTFGGGGAVRIQDLDDVDISTAKVNNKFLKYDSASAKWVGADASGGGYTLPVGSATTLGGVKVGSGLTITTTGILSTTSGGSGITTDTVSTNSLNVVGLSTFNDDVQFVGANTNARWDKSKSDLVLYDSTRLTLGSNEDFQMWHGGSHTFVKNMGGDLRIRGDKILLKREDDTERYLEANVNNEVSLFFNGDAKLATSNTGITVTGTVAATAYTGDGSGLTGITGSGSGVVVQHDGSNVGTAGTINFSTNLDVTAIHAGIVTVTASGGGSGITTETIRSDDIVTDGITVGVGTITICGTNLFTANSVVVDGITTSTSFSGSAAGLTNLTGASSGTYGNASATPVITVDGTGKITGISTVAISGVGTGGGGGGSLSSRTTTNASTGSIAQAASANITIPTPGKSFSLLKVAISAPAYVILYTDSTSRSNDASRSEGTDPTPGSGVLTEVSTTTSGASTFLMTPAVLGWNNDSTPANQIYAKVVNKRATSGSNAITVTLTSVALES